MSLTMWGLSPPTWPIEHKDRYRTERRVNIMLSLVQQVATRSTWQGQPAHRRPKGRKGPQHAGSSSKRWEAGANQATASPDPPGTVKAGLLQARVPSYLTSYPYFK
jgi:hypothetical protein